MTRRAFYLMLLAAFLLSACGTEGLAVTDAAAPPQSPTRQEIPTRDVPSGNGSYSGDDPYDPAAESSDLIDLGEATGSGEILPVTGEQLQHRMAENYSGDDPYDPAVGGRNR